MRDRVPAVLEAVDAGMALSIERLIAWLRIPSVSAVAEHAEDCGRAADWIASMARDIGFDADVRPTSGLPIVVGRARSLGAPKALFYGHYDVQPADPLSEWLSPPFAPDIRAFEGGRLAIFARGASDDKGQVMTFIEACRAWRTVTGQLPIDVTIIIEGEEEVGSPNLSPFLTANIAEFEADFALICDNDMAAPQVPAITTSLRGLVHDELTITCARCDLHSGVYGNAARNPLHVMSGIIAALHDDSGGIAIPGFYDGVLMDSPCETQSDAALELTAENFLYPVGLSVSAGEKGYSILRQTTERPSLDVNGLWGGYCGDGAKTIIPSQAHAKVSMRLVAGQEPDAARGAFRAFVRARLPADCSVSFAAVGKGTPALVLKSDTPLVKTVKAALAEEWGSEAALIATGGSIPAASDFARLGLPVVMTGFSLAEDGQHSPNEKYDLQSFHRGIRSWVRVLAALSDNSSLQRQGPR